MLKLVFSLLIASIAVSQDFKDYDIGRKASVTIPNCPAIAGLEIDKIIIKEKGSTIGVPKSYKRSDAVLPFKFRYWRCYTDGRLYAATSANPTQIYKIELAEADFPKSSIGGKCRILKPVPKAMVWKITGSEHIPPSDCRRFSVAAISRFGTPGPFPNCLEVIDRQGNTVTKLGKYYYAGAYAARYYGCFGCGKGGAVSGAQIAAKARANTGSSSVYLNHAGVCYGPINPAGCVNSSHC